MKTVPKRSKTLITQETDKTMDRQLNNMLVKKSSLSEINKEETFTQGFKDWRKIKRKVSQNLGDLQNLLIKLNVLKPAQKKRGNFMSFLLV